MSRRVLPNRRYSENFDMTCLGSRYTVRVGYYEDGTVGEVFIISHKVGSQADINARDAAVLLSLVIQHGISPESILSSLMHDAEGEPEGVVGLVVAEVVKEIKERNANAKAKAQG